MHKSKYFKIHELVDRKSFETVDEWKLWLTIDDRILRLLDLIRDESASAITVNNYMYGGVWQWRGVRNADCDCYSQYSQHAYGRAVDFDIKSMSARKSREFIADLFDGGVFKDVTNSITLETNVNWVHLDVRNNNPGINYFKG